MQVDYKFYVGQRFWVPRVNKVIEVETIEVDGKEYRREVTTYYPFVKEKEIVEAIISVGRKTKNVEYGIKTVGFPLDTPSFIDEDRINCRTKEEAEQDAAQSAVRCQECYDY